MFINRLILVSFTSLMIFGAVAPLTQFAQAASQSGSTYVLDGAQVHYQWSQVVGQLYKLDVSLPGGYEENPEQDYPVVFVLDGQWDFTVVRDIVGKTNYDGMIPDVITVAISWGGQGDDPNQLRQRDFVPSEFPFLPLAGGAGDFLNAIETELLPYIDSIYRTNEERVLMGSSFGGLFTTFAMLERPELFDGYIAMAAPYGLEYEYFSNKLAALAGGNYFDGIRAYFAAGTLDPNLAQVNGFLEELTAFDFQGLTIAQQAIDNLGHSAASVPGYTYGLQYIFARPELALPSSILQRYVGDYTAANIEGFPVLSFSVEDDQLLLSIPGQGEVPFFAQSETEFYVKGTDIDVTFSPDGDNWSALLNELDNQYHLTRVSDQ